MKDSYVGMDRKYYVGYQHVFRYSAEDELEDHSNCSDGSDSASGRSSNTFETHVTTTSQAEGAAADMMAVELHQGVTPVVGCPHPPRRRQRKPNRRAVKSQAESPAVISPIRKGGRRPKAAGNKPRSPTAARSSEGNNNVAGQQKRLQVKAPPNPPTLRTRPPRNTPKKLWAEDEVETGAWWGKKGGAAQARVDEEEEEAFTDYSPTQARKGRASGPKKIKQVQEGGSSHPNRKKQGGPCVSCHVATAATWRRGSEGRAYDGQPLCNRCGVWYSRHPDSPPGAFAAEARTMDQLQEDAQQGGLQEGMQEGHQEALQGVQEGQQGAQQGNGQMITRRRVTTRRGYRHSSDSARATSEQTSPDMDSTAHPTVLASQPLALGEATASAQAQAEQPMLRTTAVDEAATAAAVAPAISVQQLEDDNLMARTANAAQSSMLQSLAGSGTASMEEDSIVGQEEGVQRGQVGGAKLSRKRAAVEDYVQPAAKRRQLDGLLTGGQSKKGSLWQTASAAAAKALGGGRHSMEAAQGEDGVAEGVMASHFNTVLNTAAMS